MGLLGVFLSSGSNCCPNCWCLPILLLEDQSRVYDEFAINYFEFLSVLKVLVGVWALGSLCSVEVARKGNDFALLVFDVMHLLRKQQRVLSLVVDM